MAICQFGTLIMPLGVLLVMKTLEDEWHVVIKATVFETFFCYNILRVCAIQSTDSIILYIIYYELAIARLA